MKKVKTQLAKATAILMMAIIVSGIFAITPLVNAQTTQKSYLFVSATPNPVGVGQSLHISMWIHPLPPTARDIFHGFKVTVTKPDGTIDDLGTLNSDPLGSQYISYVPTTTGEFSAKVEYPGETFTSVNVTYSAATATADFTVQQEPISLLPIDTQPIPNDYWTRPISAEHRNWNSITGDWLVATYDSGGSRYGTNNGFNPYTQAPRSPHVLWTQREQLGGLVGGALGSASTYPGTIYDGKLYPPIIMSGVIFYNQFQDKDSDPEFVARDIKTGQLLYTGNFTLGCGQVYNTQGYNGQGAYYYLWDFSTNNSYTMYDAWTGHLRARWYRSAGGVSGQSNYILMGDLGDLYTFYTGGNSTYRWVAMWNSTKAWTAAGILDGSGSSRSSATGRVLDWNTGIQYNVSIPNFAHAGYGNPSLAKYCGDNIWLLTASASAQSYQEGRWLYGMDCLTGQILWNSEWTTDSGQTGRDAFGEGYFGFYHPGPMTWSIYDARTGTHVESDPAVAPWGSYAAYAKIAYGKLLEGGYDGYMKAFDVTTGKLLWKTLGDNAGLETPYGVYPLFSGPIVGGGVVFYGYDEHTPNNPLYEGASVYAFDVESGTKLWKLPAYIGLKAIADGCLVGYNAYTAETWVIGKGPSKTTVTAPSTEVITGAGLVIQGTVTDQSPGQPNTPAISDADQGAWQGYLHEQHEIPYSATGVPVYLSALASDGTSIDLGIVYSDMSGTFTRTWTPTVAGDYKIYATFQGTDSYGSSYAETTMTVAGASTTPTAAPDIQGPIMTTTIALGIAILIAIAIVGLLLLRKK